MWNNLDGGEVAKLRQERDEAVRDREAAEAQNEALHVKLAALAPHGSCACAYDKAGDVCAHHSPALLAAETENARLRLAMQVARDRLGAIAGGRPSYASRTAADTYAKLRSEGFLA